MPRKAKAPTGTVEFVNKPEQASEPQPAPSILSEPPKVDVPEQGSPTSAPAPPPAPKAKRAYNKKHGAYWEAMSKSRKEMLMPKPEAKEEPKNEIVVPPPEEAPKKGRGRPKKVAPPPPPPSPPPKPGKE
jgi:filamentous hemagglutinin